LSATGNYVKLGIWTSRYWQSTLHWC